jgi:hypothetical protein
MKDKFLYFPRSMRLFIEPESDQGGGGGGKQIPDASTDLQRRLAAAEGSAAVVAQQLANENFTLRSQIAGHEQTIATQKTKIADLQKAIPAEGAVVLTTEEAKAWQALKAIGSPEEGAYKFTRLPKLEEKLAEHDRTATLRRAAAAEGYVEKAFAGIAGVGDLSYEFKTEQRDNKPVEVAYVKVKDADTKEEKLVRLGDHMQAHYAEHMPALKPEEKTTGIKFVKQDVSGKAPEKNIYNEIRERKKQQQEEKKKESRPLRERLNMARSA